MSPSIPPVRLRSPVDILAAVPFLFGFHPADSLVLLALQGKAVCFHARVDLPLRGASSTTLSKYGAELAEIFVARGARAVVLIGYGPADRVDPALQATERAMRKRSLEVADRIRADEGRFWCYDCTNPECCPPVGTPYDVDASPVLAQAVFAGYEVAPDRESVVRSLAPPTELALVSICQATERAEARLAEMFEAGADGAELCAKGIAALERAIACYASDGRLDDDELAWLSLLLMYNPVRDLAWSRIDLDGVDCHAHRRLWTDLVRRCDPAFAAPAAMLLSYLMWRIGDVVRATAAVDRALAADPGYPTARLMAEVLNHAIPPWALDKLAAADRAPGTRRERRARQRAAQRKAAAAEHGGEGQSPGTAESGGPAAQESGVHGQPAKRKSRFSRRNRR